MISVIHFTEELPYPSTYRDGLTSRGLTSRAKTAAIPILLLTVSIMEAWDKLGTLICSVTEDGLTEKLAYGTVFAKTTSGEELSV